MNDPRSLHRRAGAMAAGVIARIPAGRLADPTPCAGWDVRALINHMVGGNLRFAAIVTGEPPPQRGDNLVGDDPLAAFQDSLETLCAAFDRAGMLEQTFPTPIGEGPGRTLVAMRVSELTVHTWDLLAALGEPRDLDPELVAFAERRYRDMPLPREAGGLFGPEQPSPENAAAGDRLAAYVGRRIPQGP